MSAINPSIYEKFIIESADGKKSVDIREGVISFTYYENLFSPTLTAKVIVVNSSGTVQAEDGKIKSLYNPQNPLKFMLIDKLGRPLLIRESFDQNKIDEVIELNQINSGLFILLVYDGNFLLSSKKLIINR